MILHKSGNKSHLQKYFRSKGTGSDRNIDKKYTNELLEWVTNNPGVSDKKDLATAIMTSNNNKYR